MHRLRLEVFRDGSRECSLRLRMLDLGRSCNGLFRGYFWVLLAEVLVGVGVMLAESIVVLRLAQDDMFYS